MQIIQKLALILAIVGAVNWGLVGLFDFNLVSVIFTNEMLQNVIYSAVGVGGLISISFLFIDLDKKQKNM